MRGQVLFTRGRQRKYSEMSERRCCRYVWVRWTSPDGSDPQVVSHRRALFGVDHAPPCIDKVLRADGGTIRPVRIVPQVEFVLRAGSIDGPRGSDPGHNGSVGGLRRQPFIEIAQHL